MASSRVPSFLKKIGSDNTATLHIPSSFVKSQGESLSASLTLQGPSTGEWTVAAEGSFSKCNVTLGRGWTNFVKDHHLQLGDQLLFCLTGQSYFLVEVYDESGCQKLSALDAINSSIPLDSNFACDTTPELEAKTLEGDKSSKANVECSPVKKPVAQQKQKKSSEPSKVSSSMKATISLSSTDSEQDAPSSSVGKQASEKLRTKRGRPKKSQDFYQDVEEEDFSLFHRPRARNTPKRSAAEDAGEAVKRLATKKKPFQEEVVYPLPKPKGFGMQEKVGHGFLRCHFIIDGSLEVPGHALEAN